MCKGSNVFSRPVLIGRGLDLIHYSSLCRFEGARARNALRVRFVHKVSGGHSEGEPPLPIPNREVKPLYADGTAGETLWESRKPPGLSWGPPAMAGPPFRGGAARSVVGSRQQSCRRRPALEVRAAWRRARTESIGDRGRRPARFCLRRTNPYNGWDDSRAAVPATRRRRRRTSARQRKVQ